MISECTLTSGLAAYSPSQQRPWEERAATHVFARLGFGASPDQIKAALDKDPVELVHELIDQAIEAPELARPTWASWSVSDYGDFQVEIQNQLLEFALQVIDNMLDHPLKAKMNLFWHNHFVTRYDQYICPSWLFDYYSTLERNSFGNFEAFTREIGTRPAMLVFLNGAQNTRFNPNENYARELLELFTLGRDQGYTQTDIVNAARALTGWNGFTELCAPISFRAQLHDPGQKTIFGRTGPWNYDTLHDLLFEERKDLIAVHICRKLYSQFISPDVDEIFVNDLAQLMVQHHFELEPIYRLLFSSERFFDPLIMNTCVKGPLEYYLGYINMLKAQLNAPLKTLLLFQSAEIGQFLFNPPTVAGWPGNRSWINTSLLTQRWLSLDAFAYQILSTRPERYKELIFSLTSSTDDPYKITRDVVNGFIPAGLQSEFEYEQLTQIFKWEVPENYFEDGSWNIYWDTMPFQTIALIQQIIRLPEFQLI
jgi:uncharacterized protein (DUF1800 family)